MTNNPTSITDLIDLQKPGHRGLYNRCQHLRWVQEQMIQSSGAVIEDFQRHIENLTGYDRPVYSRSPLSTSFADDLNRNRWADILEEQRSAIVTLCHDYLNREADIMEEHCSAIMTRCHMLQVNAAELLRITLDLRDDQR